MSEQLTGSENGFESHSLRQTPVDSVAVAPQKGEKPAKTGQFLYPKFTQLKRSPISRKRKNRSRKPKIDYAQFSYGKPVKRDIGGIREYPDGRMIFNRRHVQGAHLYRCATVLMAERQNWLCSICGQPMLYEEASFEHGGLRGLGGALRNDNPEMLDAEGYYQNSAAHGLCNGIKGSRRDYPIAIRLKPST